MHLLGYIVVFGMLMAVVGIALCDANARLLAGGLALCIGVLVHWVNALQKQVDALTSNPKSPEEKPGS